MGRQTQPAATAGEENGIARGYASGDLTMTADWFDGASDEGEFTVGGTYIVRNNTVAIDHIVYDSFGQIEGRDDASVALRFAYTGRELASEIGDDMYYYRRRFYDAPLGRFISQDPLSFAAGDSNLYRYVNNSPANATDPSGLCKIYDNAYSAKQAFSSLSTNSVISYNNDSPSYSGSSGSYLNVLNYADSIMSGTADYSTSSYWESSSKETVFVRTDWSDSITFPGNNLPSGFDYDNLFGSNNSSLNYDNSYLSPLLGDSMDIHISLDIDADPYAGLSTDSLGDFDFLGSGAKPTMPPLYSYDTSTIPRDFVGDEKILDYYTKKIVVTNFNGDFAEPTIIREFNTELYREDERLAAQFKENDRLLRVFQEQQGERLDKASRDATWNYWTTPNYGPLGVIFDDNASYDDKFKAALSMDPLIGSSIVRTAKYYEDAVLYHQKGIDSPISKSFVKNTLFLNIGFKAAELIEGRSLSPEDYGRKLTNDEAASRINMIGIHYGTVIFTAPMVLSKPVASTRAQAFTPYSSKIVAGDSSLLYESGVIGGNPAYLYQGSVQYTSMSNAAIRGSSGVILSDGMIAANGRMIVVAPGNGLYTTNLGKVNISPVAPESTAQNRALFEQYKDGLRQQMSKPHTTNPELTNLMDDLYRPGAKVGSGSTADAVRHELATGEMVGGRTHITKAQEYSGALRDWLQKNPTASSVDRAAAENVLRDLQNALGGN